MSKKIKIFQTIVFCLISFSAIGQEWTTDTLKWGNKTFIAELPENFTRNTDYYSEGVFISYSYPDTSVFTVFHGSNSKISLYQQERFDTLSINSNSYAGKIKQTNKYWKIIKQSDEFIIWYNLVNKEKVKTFDRIIESFKWEE